MRTTFLPLILISIFTHAQEQWRGIEVQQIISTNGRNYSIKVAETNQDGFKDLVVLQTDAFDKVRIYKGNDTDEFTLNNEITKQENYRLLEAGDLNADGIDDLVISGYWNNGFKLFWGTASGTFEEGEHYPLTGHGRSVKATDINEDGFMDIVAFSGGSGQPITLHIFEGNGSKTLSPKGIYSSGLHTDRSITILDKDKDGLLDIMVASSFPLFVIFYQQANGDFVPRYWPTELSEPFSFSYFLADLNNDSREDVIANYYGEGFRFYEGMADTLFSQHYVSLPTDFYPYRVYSQDINQDGNMDLITDHQDLLTDELTDTIVVLLGNGDFTFANPIKFKFPGAIEFFSVEKLNEDEFPDIVASCKGVGIVTAFNTGRITGVEFPAEEDAVFPNPFGEDLIVQLTVPEPISLISSHGNVVLKNDSSKEHRINAQDLERGLYMLRIGEGRSLRYRKVVKR